MRTHNFIEHVADKGQEILTRFQSALSDNPAVKDVRGLGYMIGIELDRPCAELVAQALEKRVLINVTQGNTIRLLPAFVMSNDQTDQLIETVVELVNQFTQQG